jgi:hypothetical protein
MRKGISFVHTGIAFKVALYATNTNHRVATWRWEEQGWPTKHVVMGQKMLMDDLTVPPSYILEKAIAYKHCYCPTLPEPEAPIGFWQPRRNTSGCSCGAWAIEGGLHNTDYCDVPNNC